MPTKKKAAVKKITKKKVSAKTVIKKAATKKPAKKTAPTQVAPETKEMVKFVLRIEPKLHQVIKQMAKDNNTSMNREISNILTDSAGPNEVMKKLDEILAAVK